MKKNIILIFLIMIILASAIAGIWYVKNKGNKSLSSSVSPAPSSFPIAEVTYICNGDKTIGAAFYKGESKPVQPGQPPIPSGSVKIVLSDGRNFNLPQTISASGARYANGDETFVFWNKGDTAFITEGTDNTETFSNCVSEVNCVENSKYFMISKKSDQITSDFLVKYKTNSGQKISCSYNAEKTDFEIKGLEATYFLALTDNFLIFDRGTAPPPRILIIYDLNSRKEVYIDKYSDPIDVSNEVITYWSPTDEKPTNKNCSKLQEYLSYGLGAEIEAYVSLDLSNLAKKELGERRCSATQ